MATFTIDVPDELRLLPSKDREEFGHSLLFQVARGLQTQGLSIDEVICGLTEALAGYLVTCKRPDLTDLEILKITGSLLQSSMEKQRRDLADLAKRDAEKARSAP